MIGTDIFVGENKGDSSSQSKRDALEQELVIITSPRIVREFKGGGALERDLSSHRIVHL